MWEQFTQGKITVYNYLGFRIDIPGSSIWNVFKCLYSNITLVSSVTTECSYISSLIAEIVQFGLLDTYTCVAMCETQVMKTFIVVSVLLLCTSFHLCHSRKENGVYYTNRFMVQVDGNQLMAKKLAKAHGMRMMGPVSETTHVLRQLHDILYTACHRVTWLWLCQFILYICRLVDLKMFLRWKWETVQKN